MFEMNTEQLMLHGNYESLVAGHVQSANFRRVNPNRFTKTAKLISTRRTDGNAARSAMPKTAINFYNMRKGLYLKNGGRGMSLSRENSKMTGSHDQCIAKSTGILNAYGELANLNARD